MTNFATKIVSVWPPLRKRFIPTFRFFVRKVGYFKKVGNMTQEEFLTKCYSLYGDKYDFSTSIYKGSNGKVYFKCNRCGTLLYKSANSIISGTGTCKFCDGSGQVRNTTQFIQKAKMVHGDKYDYSKVDYKKAHSKVEIICRVHGSFFQTPNAHLNGQGCPLCRPNVNITQDEFLKRARFMHGEKYDYSLVKFNRICEKYPIICPFHGIFYQNAHNHLSGQGCPICKDSKGEKRIAEYLLKEKVNYIAQKKIHNENLFCNNKFFYVDFYLPSFNAIIEYNGVQHYKNVPYFHEQQDSKRDYEEQKTRDYAIKVYCKEHGIRLIEIPYWDYDNIETILKKELKLKNITQ